jgi:DNA (cytosine-5)-methyltransferase 1
MNLKYIDLFCGIGGFRLALEGLTGSECVFSSDIDPHCRHIYKENFGEEPAGDITQVNETEIPDHDLLLAGFPCQSFSIIGKMKGFEDTRGTLFFDIARILNEKRPQAFVLENVKQLVGHNKGDTLKVILKALNDIGYNTHWKVLNALDYGLPQKRERIFIVGSINDIDYKFPEPKPAYTPLFELLEKNVNQRYYASDKIKAKRKAAHTSNIKPAIWHENKSGNISSYPYSCALRAGASYNYLLVNGERRLTPREMLRLQGFPDSYKIAVNDFHMRRLAGNSIPVNMARAVINNFLPHLENVYA